MTWIALIFLAVMTLRNLPLISLEATFQLQQLLDRLEDFINRNDRG